MKSTTVAIGIGRLGLCFAVTLQRAGYRGVGVDTRQPVLNKLLPARSQEPGLVEGLRDAANLQVTTDLSDAVTSSVIFILVSTPTDGADT